VRPPKIFEHEDEHEHKDDEKDPLNPIFAPSTLSPDSPSWLMNESFPLLRI